MWLDDLDLVDGAFVVTALSTPRVLSTRHAARRSVLPRVPSCGGGGAGTRDRHERVVGGFGGGEGRPGGRARYSFHRTRGASSPDVRRQMQDNRRSGAAQSLTGGGLPTYSQYLLIKRRAYSGGGPTWLSFERSGRGEGL